MKDMISNLQHYRQIETQMQFPNNALRVLWRKCTCSFD